MVSPVSVLLVSHDGARWLPAVLDGLAAQTVPAADVVAVDTGSRDESPDLLEQAGGTVLRLPASTSFPVAVDRGLDELRSRAEPSEWVWILHDDSRPEPGALAALLAAAAEDPRADLLGPKLREWPSLRRLLELGVTISATGRRETGLERGEYDQGQHDEVREVLAVNTAGLLVRRTVLEELGGLDPQLPVFGNDIDLGWRAAAAGHRTVVVPAAVVFHAEAAHRGLRRTALTGRHPHYQQRRAALYTLLANASRRRLPWLVVRLLLGTLVRMVGFLLVRAVGEALDDVAALLSLYARPGQVLAARRARRARGTLVAPGDDAGATRVRSVLAPWWVPYRHGLDLVGDILTAATNQASDVAERRRVAASEHAPASSVSRPAADEDELVEDSGLAARFLTNPVALMLTLVVVLALVAARAAFGPLAGGGLSPVPESAGDWWRLHVETWHALGTGTAVPAPAYVLPLALLATLLGGSPGAAIAAIMLLAVPLALWGAWRFLRVVGRLVTPRGASRWALLWGAVTWALAPVACGAWTDGRLGVVVLGALLPWLAHAALAFADPTADRRRRASWRVGVLLALGASFAPVLWLLAVALAAIVTASAAVVVRGAARDRSVWGPPAVALLLPLVLLSPWWITAVRRGAAEAFLLDTGRLPAPVVGGADLLAGRLAGLGAPAWAGWVLAALAVLALVPRPTRLPVVVCWVVGTVTAAVAAVLSTITVDLTTASLAPGLGSLVLVGQGCLVTAVLLGAAGATGPRADASGNGLDRRVAGAGRLVLAAVAVVVPLAGLGWWLAEPDPIVARGIETDVPVYMAQSSAAGPGHGILAVRGTAAEGLTYTVRRGDGITLGEDEIVDLAGPDRGFTDLVEQLVSRPTPAVVAALADRGIEYVVLPSPADGDVAATLDAASGLVQASAEDRTTRAWQIGQPLGDRGLTGETSWLRVVLLVVQGVGVVVALVLCLPTTNGRRSS